MFDKHRNDQSESFDIDDVFLLTHYASGNLLIHKTENLLSLRTLKVRNSEDWKDENLRIISADNAK